MLLSGIDEPTKAPMKAQTTSLRCAQKQLPYKLALLVPPGRRNALYFNG
jgi:hypothetical protein